MFVHKRNFLAACIFITSLATSVFADIQLYYNHNGFQVIQDSVCYQVAEAHIDPTLRGIHPQDFKDLLNTHGVYILQKEDSAFVLKVGLPIVMAPCELGKVHVELRGNGLCVVQNGQAHDVSIENLDAQLREIVQVGQLHNFYAAGGYIEVSQCDNRDFILKAQVRGLGGGPITAAIAYWGVKGIGYAAMVFSASSIAVTTSLATGGAGSHAGLFLAEEAYFAAAPIAVPIIENIAIGASVAASFCPWLP